MLDVLYTFCSLDNYTVHSFCLHIVNFFFFLSANFTLSTYKL